ncbi:maleylpyruvate isomerase family mycothiol-dependent enzyme [Streptomyces sp. cmx-4-9]|uniref:maleylpyruvate isomerase family mycothiol-dependent enzyme n=1 Tax=Streptomyces sp. cmx-4-9 TaxID=2790941 RepID=UPI003980042C
MTDPEEPGGPDRPGTVLPLLTTAADAVLRSAHTLDDAAVRAPSRLPGWTRAHVLVHLARGADSRVRLLTAARTGADLPQYPDEQTRADEIRQGALRDAAAIHRDLQASLEGVLRAVAEQPSDTWDIPVRWLGGGLRPARGVLWSLLRELEIHHVDLAAAYAPTDWSAAFVARQLAETVRDLRADPAVPGLQLRAGAGAPLTSLGSRPGPLVAGSPAGVLAWLIGRSDGGDLTVSPAGALPRIPVWRR